MATKMKPHVHAALIKQWADGVEIEYFDTYKKCWIPTVLGPAWDPGMRYRIKDPYRELKEAAADPNKEIRLLKSDGNGKHSPWQSAGYGWEWVFPPEEYEIRDKPDPYAELKAAAKDPTKQIRYGWGEWQDCGGNFEWTAPVDCYEIRDKPKAKVKMWQWVFKDSNSERIYLGSQFYPYIPKHGIKRADWTMIEVEE